MGHKHTRDDILEGAMQVAFHSGLSQLTFGRVAKHLGISDRVVVYYFPSKDDLVAEALSVMGARLQVALAPAFSTPVPDHVALVRAAWPVVARVEADPVFALFFEAGGLAATGREPYAALVPALVDAWIDWAAALLDCPRRLRRTEAEAAIAMIDGLLLMRQLAGPAAADRAARRLTASPRTVQS